LGRHPGASRWVGVIAGERKTARREQFEAKLPLLSRADYLGEKQQLSIEKRDRARRQRKIINWRRKGVAVSNCTENTRESLLQKGYRPLPAVRRGRRRGDLGGWTWEVEGAICVKEGNGPREARRTLRGRQIQPGRCVGALERWKRGKKGLHPGEC